MPIALNIAAILAVIVGIAHSYLGERYILIRLFRFGGLPKLYGGTEFTIRTLRFAWHITTIAWWGFAAIITQLAHGTISTSSVAFAIGITFVATGVVTLVISKTKHFAWPIFMFIGCVSLYAAAG
jgi:hypothetical protein